MIWTTLKLNKLSESNQKHCASKLHVSILIFLFSWRNSIPLLKVAKETFFNVFNCHVMYVTTYSAFVCKMSGFMCSLF